jgi:mono/diheme cytochrome c family protein
VALQPQRNPEQLAPTKSESVLSSGLIPKIERAADLANGERLYKNTCVYCHGDHGQGGEGGGKPISPALEIEGILSVLRAGRDKMPAFGAALKPEELQDLATYVHQRLLVP